MHEDDKCPLTADEIDQELKEGVNDKGLVLVNGHRCAGVHGTDLVNVSERLDPG